MIRTREPRGGIADAVAAARDEALIEMGRKAGLRQERRYAAARSGRALVAVAVAAGAALAAGAVAYRMRTRRNGTTVDGPGGPHGITNGTVSEHEHAEDEEEVIPSRR